MGLITNAQPYQIPDEKPGVITASKIVVMDAKTAIRAIRWLPLVGRMVP